MAYPKEKISNINCMHAGECRRGVTATLLFGGSCSSSKSLRLDEPGDFEACGACVTYCSPPTRLQIFLAISGGGLVLMQI